MRRAYELFEGASQVPVGHDVIGVDLFYMSRLPLADLHLNAIGRLVLHENAGNERMHQDVATRISEALR
jgi:hypothetical protein